MSIRPIIIRFSCVAIAMSYLSFCGISCNEEKPAVYWFDQHVPLSQIKADTAYGYPYPSIYPWDEIVKRGEANIIPHHTSIAPPPLWTLLTGYVIEVYRLDAFPYKFTVLMTDTSAAIDVIMAICNEKWLSACLEHYRSLEKKTAHITLSLKQTAVFRKKIKDSRFWQMCADGKGTGGSTIVDGYGWEMEGIKDSIYSVVWQTEPAQYYKEFYLVGKWLIERAQKNGLTSNTPWN